LICRHWRGIARPEPADQYVAHLREQTFPALARLPGFIAAELHRRDLPEGVEFLVLTRWQSLPAIQAFAGPDVTRAVVPPEAQALLLDWDHHATHYEVVE
jgi:heme-degrading monooxygenase HmoA